PVATAAPAAAAGTSGDRTDWPEKFTVGFFGGDDAEKVLKDNEPLRVYMEEELGMPVEFFTGTSYSAVIEAMRANRVDAMEVGPFSYVLAVQEAKAEALAINTSESGDVVKYNPDVPPHYYSAIITKKGSGIVTLEDLKDKNFAFVDPASTSGHLAPKTLLVQNNIDPDTEMKTVFAGSHPTAVLAVWNGSADAGATFEGNLYTLQKEGQIEFCNFEDNQIGRERTPEEIKAVYDACPDGSIAIIAMSDEIPSTPFAVRSNLPDSFKATVKASLLAVKDDPELVASFGQWYTDPSEEMGLESLDQYYNSLRDIAKLLNLDLKELGG
ncbi:MAG: phosphate/phosphite/phosphonate ABC transporter substrate-binding protein, partial [Roseiflexaceae bacterium]|nr:phosphate/phosphite/phosphonate ABC transporter substrate-binding protein [Roseiflexaceae bacterium]